MGIKLKKALAILVAVLTVCSLASVLSGCFVKEYTVKYDLQGGTLVYGQEEQTVKKGGSAMAPVTEREGYEFAGWDKDAVNVTENLTVTAVWKKLCTVTFNIGEGAESSDELVIQVAEGDKPTPPDVSREGYELDGWDPKIKSVTKDTEYTAVWTRSRLEYGDVYEYVSPCVGKITAEDSDGYEIGSGTGFFIDGDGTMVTSFSAIKGAYYAEVSTLDGQTCTVKYVIDYDADLDIAMIKTDAVGNNFLEIAENGASSGDTVYAIGYSTSRSRAVAEGTVSDESSWIGGETFIMISSSVTSDNGGGPLLDEYGCVLGVNSLSHSEENDSDLAVPIYCLDDLDQNGKTLMSVFGAETEERKMTGGGTLFYEDADSVEAEPNDNLILANVIEPETGFAGGLTGDDKDVLRYEPTESCVVSMGLLFESGEAADNVIAAIARYDENNDPEILAMFESPSDEPNVKVANAAVTGSETYYVVLVPSANYGDTLYYYLYFAEFTD